MKLLKILLIPVLIIGFQLSVRAQGPSLIGDWQLVKQGSCLEETASSQADSGQSLRKDMQTHTTATPQVVNFKENSSGEESTRILNNSKSANQKKFFYKFNGEMLLILDKKTQTISDSYLVDKFTSDSLIVSNSARPCETKIFVKISEDQAN